MSAAAEIGAEVHPIETGPPSYEPGKFSDEQAVDESEFGSPQPTRVSRSLRSVSVEENRTILVFGFGPACK